METLEIWKKWWMDEVEKLPHETDLVNKWHPWSSRRFIHYIFCRRFIARNSSNCLLQCAQLYKRRDFFCCVALILNTLTSLSAGSCTRSPDQCVGISAFIEHFGSEREKSEWVQPHRSLMDEAEREDNWGEVWARGGLRREEQIKTGRRKESSKFY